MSGPSHSCGQRRRTEVVARPAIPEATGGRRPGRGPRRQLVHLVLGRPRQPREPRPHVRHHPLFAARPPVCSPGCSGSTIWLAGPRLGGHPCLSFGQLPGERRTGAPDVVLAERTPVPALVVFGPLRHVHETDDRTAQAVRRAVAGGCSRYLRGGKGLCAAADCGAGSSACGATRRPSKFPWVAGCMPPRPHATHAYAREPINMPFAYQRSEPVRPLGVPPAAGPWRRRPGYGSMVCSSARSGLA